MSIIIDEKKRVIVQGITGREGKIRTRLMLDYGTKVVAGCTPGRGGEVVHDVPVYDTVEEAVDQQGQIDISVIFVPAPLVKEAALESISAGVPFLVIIPDRVPIYDVLKIEESANAHGASFLGPNTLGVLSPGKATLGMIGGRASSAREWFFEGPAGVCSRSGGMTSATAYYLGKTGIGLSTIVHVGGDVCVGTPFPEVMKAFEADPDTSMIVMFGEIGGSQEERVADLMINGEITKPVVAFIGGAAAKSGTRFSHAGAIIEGNRGTYQGKIDKLKDAGAFIAPSFNDVPALAREVLSNLEA